MHLKEVVTHLCWSRLLAGPVDLGREEPTPEQVCCRTCDPWKGPMLEQFMKNGSPWEAFMLEQFMEDHLPWEGPHAGAEEEREEEYTFLRKEVAADRTFDGLTATPIHNPLSHSGGGGRVKS